MIITCNKCNARFNLEDTLIKPEGTKVRCAKCREVFLFQSPIPVTAEPKHGMAGASEDFNENLNSTDDWLGIDGMLDIDSISEETPEKSEDFDFFSIDDLQEETNQEFGRGAASEFDSECELEDIGRGLQLEPDRGEEKGFEPKVEFDDADEFAKYGTLEFNVSDMYKTLGIEVESKVETEQELPELNPDLDSEEDELDLSGIDEMLDIEEDQLGAQENDPPYAEPDDACMELDLSDLEDMLDENEEVAGDEHSELHLDLEDAIDEEDEINARTEIFNIEEIEDLDMKTGKPKDPNKGANPDIDETDADDIEGLDIGSTDKRRVPSNDDLEFQLDLDPDANKGDEEEAPEPHDLGSNSDDLDGILMDDADLGLEIEEEEDEVESLSLDLEQELEQNFANSFSDFSQELNRDGRIPPDTGQEDSDDLFSFDLESEGSDVDVDDQTEVLRLDEDPGSDLDSDEPAPKPPEDSFELSDMDLLAPHQDLPPEEEFEEGLDLDLGLEEDDPEAASDGLDLDFEDLESGDQASSEEPDLGPKDLESDETPMNPEESIDLDDVLKMDELEEREASEDLEIGLANEIPASDELGLDLEMEEDELEPDEGLAKTELYLSDDDLIDNDGDLGIDFDELEAVNTDTDQGEAAEEFDIDPDLKEDETGSAANEASEELDLDFDLEDSKPSEAEAFEENDLDDSLAEAEDKPEDSFELELDLDLEDPDMEDSTGVKAGQPQTPESEIELDLDFDMDEEDASTDRKEESLEFDLDEEIASEGSDEFDLDLEEEEEEEIAVESELRKQETEKKEEEFSDAFDMGIPADELDDLGDEESVFHEPEKKAGKKKGIRKQRKRSPAVLLLALLLFGGAGYGAYTLGFHERLNEMGFSLSKISEVGGIFRSQPQHLGEIVPLGNTVESKFIKNEEAGYLFVIRGNVKNEYSENRSFIKVRGKLFKNDNQLAVEEAVFAGNSLTDEALASMPLADIEAQLANPSGAENSNVRVHPGKVLPYTLVFSEVSPDFEEYRVEVAGSRPAE